MMNVVGEPFAVIMNFPVGRLPVKAEQAGKLLGEHALFVGARITMLVPGNVA
jgi:hypothetical protein